ncbi:MAG TPA: hypothetical protein PK252_14190, partial [Bacteroidales bacterium]|nr:hypothetical protein [Bacteroidales bacterium]
YSPLEQPTAFRRVVHEFYYLLLSLLAFRLFLKCLLEVLFLLKWIKLKMLQKTSIKGLALA